MKHIFFPYTLFTFKIYYNIGEKRNDNYFTVKDSSLIYFTLNEELVHYKTVKYIIKQGVC